MLRKRWSHWALLLLAILFGLTTALASALLGLWSTELGDRLIGHILAWFVRPQTQDALKLLGVAASAFPVVFGLYRAWYFADRNLPDRLHDYLERRCHSGLATRELLLADARILTAPMTRSSSWWSVRKSKRQREQLEKYVAELDSNRVDPKGEMELLRHGLEVATSAARQVSADIATIHYVRGTIYANAADAGALDELARKRAIGEFRLAAAHDANDFRIHREYVRQAEIGGNPDDLPTAINGWVSASANAKNFREEGVARLRLGRSFFDRSRDPSLTSGQKQQRLRNAQIELETAVELLQSNPEKGVEAECDQVLAECLEELADVRVRQGKLPSARERYTAASEIFSVAGNSAKSNNVQMKLRSI